MKMQQNKLKIKQQVLVKKMIKRRTLLYEPYLSLEWSLPRKNVADEGGDRSDQGEVEFTIFVYVLISYF